MVASLEDTQKIDVNGTRLSAYTFGAGEPAVVFISGLGDPGSVWKPVIERLGNLGTLLSYDRAGSGCSDDLAPEDASAPRPASWAAEQLHALLRSTRANQRV